MTNKNTAISSCKRLHSKGFPSDFLWGAATSSHQVEGQNRWNDWWESEQKGRLPYKSGNACRHWVLYEQDFDLARSWGHNAHRFSIEWSRIEPARGEWKTDVIAHYRKVIRGLKKRAIEPLVTLNHFTIPSWLSHAGGWLNPRSVEFYTSYVEFVMDHLGQEVRYWLTLNEPTVYVMQCYINGIWPPFYKLAWVRAIKAFINLSRAHIAAYDLMHRYRKDIMVSFAHNAPVILPHDPSRLRDRVASFMRDQIMNQAFFRLIGAWNNTSQQLSGHLDFVALNYYTRVIIRSTGCGIAGILGRVTPHCRGGVRGSESVMGWEIYPAGLGKVLKRFAKLGLPLLVTENGVATDDESQRIRFLRAHVEKMAEAVEQGIDVRGYFYWSLIDNYEWEWGTQPHFGLAAVDYKSQQRRPRPCMEIFKRICNENCN